MSWFRSVAGAMVKYGAKALAGAVPFGEVLLSVAEDIWAKYHKPLQQDNLATDLQAAAAAPAALSEQSIALAVADAAADQPDALQLALAFYLTQVPAAIHQSLRRPADPTGRTIPPGLTLRGPDDLLALLPARLPRFKVGDFPPGVGDWELVELLGIGGFGEVWKARNPHLPSVAPVALKFCLDPQAPKLLRHEATVLNRVMHQGKHPGIVSLLHTYISANPPCLEYEFVEGGDLSGLVRDWAAAGGAGVAEVNQAVLGLAEIVAHAHRQEPPIVHRDLKPANILIARDGQTFRITDFGIGGLAARKAIAAHTSGATMRGELLETVFRGACTPLYASPQQIRGEDPDPRDDVHALGVIWLQMLTGDLNRGRPSGSGWKDDLRASGLTKAMVELLERCMDDKAEKRPGNAAELAAQLGVITRGKQRSRKARKEPPVDESGTSVSTPRLLPTFDSPASWYIKRNVPIFCAHNRKGKDGKLIYEIGDRELAVICQQYSKLEKESDVVPRIAIVSTDPDDLEENQPEVIGFARNLRVGTFGPSGRTAILCDEWLQKEKAAERAKYPYRSVEFYPSRMEITSVILFNGDPQLDLGVVLYNHADPIVRHLYREHRSGNTQAWPELYSRLHDRLDSTADRFDNDWLLKSDRDRLVCYQKEVQDCSGERLCMPPELTRQFTEAELAQAAMDAMLNSGDPEIVAQIGDMLRDGYLDEEELDEDDSPVSKEAAERVRAFIAAKAHAATFSRKEH